MKILVDTNVIIDVLCNRSEFVEDSSKVWKYCEVDYIEGISQRCQYRISCIFSERNTLLKNVADHTTNYNDFQSS